MERHKKTAVMLPQKIKAMTIATGTTLDAMWYSQDEICRVSCYDPAKERFGGYFHDTIIVRWHFPEREYFGRAGWLDTKSLFIQIGNDEKWTPAMYVLASGSLTFMESERNTVVPHRPDVEAWDYCND